MCDITKSIFLSQLVIAVMLFSAQADAVYQSVQQKLMIKLQAQYQSLELAGVTLDFAEFARQFKIGKQGKQTQIIERLSQQLAAIDNQSAFTFCQQLLIDEMRFNVSLAQERQHLFATTGTKEQFYQGRFIELPQGKQWYKHWLNSWLHADVDVNELKEIAYQELADVTTKRINLTQQKLPKNVSYFLADNEAAIVTGFRAREQEVNKHIKNVLGTTFIPDAVHIERASFPKSFPAPGIYDNDSKTFLYHLSSDILPAKQMDWLFLHEGIPGHHYQNEFLEKHALCERKILMNTTVFHEGWGAYVETLGQELGLFKDADSMAYALDWQALRAVRVLIDIGIHYEGLTDEQAQQLWMKHIPQQRSIMNREIARIKRWPVQVITYVYGKHIIEQTIKQLNPFFDKKTLHRIILSYSNMRLSSLTRWVELALPSPSNLTINVQ